MDAIATSVEPYRLYSTSPNASWIASDTAGDNADPAMTITLSAERSYLPSTSGPSATIRCSIVGTATSISTFSAAIVATVCSASKRRRSTSRLPSARFTPLVANPVAWNSGETIIDVPLRGNGIRSSSSTLANGDIAPRVAPFGSPVVPLVRITNPAAASGSAGAVVSPVAAIASRVSTPSGASPSTQVRTRGRCSGNASARVANSSS